MDDATTNQAAIDPLLELAANNEVTISEQGYSEFLANRDLQYHIISHFPQWAQGGQWMFERLLFEEEKKYIILYRSEEGNIERQLVVKMEGPESLEKLDTTTLEEFRMHWTMSQLGCPHIASCYGLSWRQVGTSDARDAENYVGMGYLECLSGEDLATFRRNYTAEDEQIPEGFIWIIFRSVAEAIYAWTTGRVLSFDEPETGSPESQLHNYHIRIEDNWPLYLNYDLKPDNICLGAPRIEEFPAFPTPKVIDFGIACAWHNREGFRGRPVGADGLISPEVVRSELPDIAMEIWGLGITILNLMYTTSHDLRFWYEGQPQLNSDVPDRAYSKRLIDLVNECVSIDSFHRPQLMALLVRTREGFRQWERATVPMRYETKEKLGPIGTFIMPTLWEDEYKRIYKRDYHDSSDDEDDIPRRSTTPRGDGGNADPGDDNDGDDDNDQGGGEARHESPEQTVFGSLKFALQRFAEIYTDINQDPQNPEYRQRLMQARVHRETLENELLGVDDIQNQEQEPTAQAQQDQQHDQRQEQPQDQQQAQPQDQDQAQAQDQQPDEEQHDSPPAPKQHRQAKAKTQKAKGTKAKVTKAGPKTQAKGSRAKTGGGRSQAAPPAANQPRNLRRNRAAPGDYKKFM